MIDEDPNNLNWGVWVIAAIGFIIILALVIYYIH